MRIPKSRVPFSTSSYLSLFCIKTLNACTQHNQLLYSSFTEQFSKSSRKIYFFIKSSFQQATFKFSKMTSQKNIFIALFAVVAVLSCIMAAVQASPVASVEGEAKENMRSGRFYGLGGSQGTAFASANAVSSGLGGGYPYGGGLGIATATAAATAGAGGYPYGK